jgi:outer membrane protein assembly factor BamB
MNRPRCLRPAAIVLAFLGAPAGRSADWPGWRGPTGLGYTDEKDLPLSWNAKTGENVVWKVPLHGGGKQSPDFTSPGWSSPIVWGDRVFLTTAVWPKDRSEPERRATIAEHHVLCFRTTDGEPLWDTVVPPGKIVAKSQYHGYAVPTPATDGKLVFALFGSGVLAALDFDGKIAWREELPRLRDADNEPVCSSPVLYGDTVIVPGLHSLGLRALDKKTGKVVWEQKTNRRNTMSTPAVVRVGGKVQLIHHNGSIEGLDPTTGDVLWSCRGVPTSQASPVFGDGLLFADEGGGGQAGGAAVDPTGTGDVSKSHVKWQAKYPAPGGSSGIAVGKYLYRACNNDVLRCWEMATGKLMYEERLAGVSPSASPIATRDGRVYFASSRRSYVIAAGPSLNILATNNLDDGSGYPTPAVSNGRIVIKGQSHLWCVGKK